MSTKLQQLIQPLLTIGVFRPRDKATTGNDGEENDDTAQLSVFERILHVVKKWDPFPLRAHYVEDVNDVNKNVLLAIISFFLCTSFALVWISAFIIDARRSHEYAPTDSFSSHILSLSAIVLVISLVSFGFTLCGFIGVFRENILLIQIFYIALIVLLSFKICIAFFVISFTGAAESIVGGALGDKLVINYRASTDIENTMDYLQIKFRCCGLRERGFQDWNISMYFKCSDDNRSTERCGVPWSCCRNDTGSENALCGANVQQVDRNIASKTIYTKGCIIAIVEWASNHAFLVGFLLFLETLLLTVLIFQCTHLVNELQMIVGIYQGPWWMWIGKPRPAQRPPFAQGAQFEERPIAALPFHIELVWHEEPAMGQMAPALGQMSPAVGQMSPMVGQMSPMVGQMSPAVAVGQMSPALGQTGPAIGQPQEGEDEEAAPPVNENSDRFKHRRSTAGQRFFRAVISRASRLVHRRQAVSAEDEEQHRRSVAAPQQQQQQQQQGRADWVVHQRARDDAALTRPSADVTHTLEPLLEERVTKPSKVGQMQRSALPLPPIGTRTSESSESEEDVAVEVEPVEEMTHVSDDSLFEKRNISAPPADQPPKDVKRKAPVPKKSELTNSLLPGAVASQKQMILPNIHSRTLDKQSSQASSDVSPVMRSKPAAKNKVVPVSNAVEKPDETGNEDAPPPAPASLDKIVQAFANKTGESAPDAIASKPTGPPAPPLTEPSSPAAAVTEPPPSTSVTSTVSSTGDVRSSETETASPADVSTPRTAIMPGEPSKDDDGSDEAGASTVLSQDGEDSAEVANQETAADEIRQVNVDDGAARQMKVNDGAARPEEEEPEEADDDGPSDLVQVKESHVEQVTAPAAPTAEQQQREEEASEDSSDSRSGKKKKKVHHHHKKHKKKHKKKGRETSVTAETETSVTAGAEPETPVKAKVTTPTTAGVASTFIVHHAAEDHPIPDWLKPNPAKEANDHANPGSVHFTQSEFKHLAEVHHENPEAGRTSPADIHHHRGTVAAAISKKLHDIMPSFSPTPTVQADTKWNAPREEPTSIAQAMSKKLHDIFPKMNFYSGSSDSRSPEPSRLLSPELDVVRLRDVRRRSSTYRGAETDERDGAGPSSPRSPDSDTRR